MHKAGDKVGDGTEEGTYGDPPPGFNPFISKSDAMGPWGIGRLSYFEIFTSDRTIQYVGDFPFILACGYTKDAVPKTEGKTEKTRMNPQTFTGANVIDDLVDIYTKANTFAKGLILPVRNMRSDDEDGLELGHSPLSEEEMGEFKQILETRDPEKYRLSFPDD